MPYALGELHNCHHIPPSLPPISPSLPSVPPILTPNPPPHLLGRGGGGKQQFIDFLGSSWNFPDFWNVAPPPIPLGTPPDWGGSTFFLLVSGQFMTFPGLFIFDPLKPPLPWDPPPQGYADIPGESLPVSFGWDTKSRWSLLYGVYARGSKRSHQSALNV